MDISSAFGLPAHPLLVHVPIMLLPLVGVGAVAMLWRSQRDRIGWIVVGLAGISLIGIQLAMGSGEALVHDVPRSAALSRHTEMADALRPLGAVLFVAVLAVMLLHRRSRRTGGSGRWMRAVPVVAVLFAVAANVQLAQVGHNGARAAWQNVKIGQGEAEGTGR